MQNDIVRRMEMENIEMVVKVHIASFPCFFLSFLGSRFLSLFYYGICSAREGIAFIYLSNTGNPAGFVAGTANPRGFYSRLLKRGWFKFALASIIPIMRKPSVFWRVARAVFHPSDNPVGRCRCPIPGEPPAPVSSSPASGRAISRPWADCRGQDSPQPTGRERRWFLIDARNEPPPLVAVRKRGCRLRFEEDLAFVGSLKPGQ